ncbi:hypothetical protein HGRIS_003488 [Hohenbuehelia grisea]|uniref:Uncharacterized protein n=1 Tax=Hohenbuehelia grisea TaxID=104357 RepID=A0ABR3JH69_9AGAR
MHSSFQLLVLILLVSSFQSVVAGRLSARQNPLSDVPAPCQSNCLDWVDAQKVCSETPSSNPTTGCLQRICTQDTIDRLSTCWACIVGTNTVSQGQADNFMSDTINSCRQSGFSLNNPGIGSSAASVPVPSSTPGASPPATSSDTPSASVPAASTSASSPAAPTPVTPASGSSSAATPSGSGNSAANVIVGNTLGAVLAMMVGLAVV